MDSTPEQNPGLSSPGGPEKPATNEPTIKEIRKMGYEALLTWIKQAKPTLLSGEDLENFKKEHITGDVFLDHAIDWKSFKEGCNLPAGPSDGLAKLASEVIRKETMGTESQSYLSRHARHADTQLTMSKASYRTRQPAKRGRVKTSSI
jgi:hypothetical protein